jgi:hypothetical protein
MIFWLPIFRSWQKEVYSKDIIFIRNTFTIISSSFTSDMDATSLDLAKLAMDSTPSQLSFEETFVWEWYIRLKVTFPDHYTAADLEANINEVLTEFEEFWRSKFNLRGEYFWKIADWV